MKRGAISEPAEPNEALRLGLINSSTLLSSPVRRILILRIFNSTLIATRPLLYATQGS